MDTGFGHGHVGVTVGFVNPFTDHGVNFTGRRITDVVKVNDGIRVGLGQNKTETEVIEPVGPTSGLVERSPIIPTLTIHRTGRVVGVVEGAPRWFLSVTVWFPTNPLVDGG
jgi:hypothetical protein